MGSSEKVLLYYPYPDPGSGPSHWAPLPVMTVGSYLLHQGYEVVIIDQRLEKEPFKRVLSELEGALCLGISAITGIQIAEGVEISREVKKRLPEIPIIWGGVHPTLLPEQTVADPAIDIVVRGQGEVTMSELVKTLATKGDLREVKGLTFKENGRIFSTPPRPLTDINDFPPLSYSLIEVERYLDRYVDIAGRTLQERGQPRAITYLSSFGCPFNCRFCSENVMSQGRWFGLKAERVVNEIRDLVEEFGVKRVVFADENFFVKPSRVKEIADLILEQDIAVLWEGAGRSDSLARFSDSEVETLYHSGCRLVLVGAESGSQETLDLIGKRSSPEDTEVATRRFTSHGIMINLNYMFALPDESPESLWQTTQQVYRLAPGNHLLELTYNNYSPYPGNELFDRAVELGFSPPQSLQEWAGMVHRNVNIPSVDPDLIRKFLLLRFMFLGTGKPGVKNLPRNVVILLLRIIARLRLNLRTFALPIDLFLMDRIVRRRVRATATSAR